MAGILLGKQEDAVISNCRLLLLAPRPRLPQRCDEGHEQIRGCLPQ